MPVIKLKQWPAPLKAKRGSVLDVALAAGVPYPHSCRSGECGACKSKLHAGEVLMDGYDPQVLTPQERDAGLILACRAHPRGDVEVSWLQAGDAEALQPVRRVEATVAALEAATHDITRLTLEPEGGPLAFAAGQYAELSFADCPARPYSMANRPQETMLEFHIRRVPGGTVSGHVATKARAGDRVQLEGPYGSAHLREPLDAPMLLIAGGSGLAPMKSILLAALALGAKSPVHVYHGVRDERDLYDADAIAARARYVPVLSAACGPTDCHEGFVHEAVAQDFDTLAGWKVYLAGPPPMVDAAKAAVRALGAADADVHADAFYAARAPQPSPEAQAAPRRLLRRLFGGSG